MYLTGTHISHRLVQAVGTVKWCHISPVVTNVVEGIHHICSWLVWLVLYQDVQGVELGRACVFSRLGWPVTQAQIPTNNYLGEAFRERLELIVTQA